MRKRSLSASLKRPVSRSGCSDLPLQRDSSTAGFSNNNNCTLKSVRQVRFSETKKSAGSQNSSIRSTSRSQRQIKYKNRMVQLKKVNENLKKEIAEINQAHAEKYYDLKQRYRVLHDTLSKVDQQRKDYKEATIELKKTVKSLKKKVIYYKDRLKLYCANDEQVGRAMSPENHTVIKRTPKNAAVSQERKINK